MKREYPLFLIDRSKPSAYPFDYIACFDKQVGFVARVIFMPSETMYTEFVNRQKRIENSEYFGVTFKLKKGGIILLAEDFIYEFPQTMPYFKRIQTLLKKALKKYLHTEMDRTPIDELSIENQIKQQELTVERARSNYDELVKRSSKTEADYNIALAEAILQTLKEYKDNFAVIKLNLN